MSVTPRSRTHRVLSNGLYNLAPQFWFLALALVTTPFILHQLGVEAYGLLSIVGILSGYLAFLDLGLNLATIRFFAAHDAKGEAHEVERVAQTSFAVFLSVALIVSGALALLARPLASLLHAPANLQGDAVFVLRLAALSFGVNLVLGVFSAVPRALQRFDIVNAVNAVLGTLQVAVTVALLAGGLRLRALAIWSVALSSVSLATYAFFAQRLMPGVRFVPRFDRAKFRELASFSGYVMVSNFTGIAGSHSEKLILGGMAPIAQVTYYSVPFNLIWRVLTIIPSNLFAVLFPALSALSVTDSADTLRDTYVRAFRFIFVVVAPISILLFAFGPQLLELWLGEDMAVNGGPVLIVLAAALLINAPAWVSVTVGQSVGRPALVAAGQIVHVVVLIGSGLLLIPRFGALGAAVSWLVANLIGIPTLIVLVNRFALALPTGPMLRTALAGPVATGALALGGAALLRPLVTGPLSLIVAVSVFILLYAPLAYLIALDEKDRSTMKSFMRVSRPASAGAD